MERAGYLPGLSADAVTWERLAFGRGNDSLEIEAPLLSETQIAQIADHVRAHSRDYLKTLPVARIVDIVDAAVARLLDRNDPYRRKAEEILPLVTGYDAEMVRLGLTEYLKTFRRHALLKFIAEDFANPLMLDGFQPMPKGGFARADGPGLLVHVWAGNVPGLPLWSLISGLLVKAGTIGKVATGEPLFAGWFAELLAEIDPKLGDCLAVLWWRGGDETRESALLSRADTVLAYGGNRALEDLRHRVPVTARFLPHGHKISFAMVSRAVLDSRKASPAAHQAAHDVVRYDQQGCYSPQTIFVERGGKVSPREFARYVAGELASFERKFPRRALTIAEAGDVAAWRNAEELKSLSQPGSEILGDAAGAWSVAYQESVPDLAPSGLNRTVRIVAVDTLDDVAPAVAPHRTFLQTAGIAAAPEELFRLADGLAAAGVTRICALGRMAAPEAGWHHDGRFSLLDLVTISEIEGSAERAAEDFAPYAD